MILWTQLSKRVDSFTDEITIALVGKYVKIKDAYTSVTNALSHAAIKIGKKLIIKFVDSELLETPKLKEGESRKECKQQEKLYETAWKTVRAANGIVVPGGFGKRGVEGKIACCKYARENKVPFLGICLGMHCAVIEFSRNILGIERANSTEFYKELTEEQQIIFDMPDHNAKTQRLGGTMRLGKKTTIFLIENSKLRKLYGMRLVNERHRHRYEISPKIAPKLNKKVLLFIGVGVDENFNAFPHLEDETAGNLLQNITDLCNREGNGTVCPAVRMEIIEMQNHPYFVGTQFHPEYLSFPLKPSPPFLGLLLASAGQLENFLAHETIQEDKMLRSV